MPGHSAIITASARQVDQRARPAAHPWECAKMLCLKQVALTVCCFLIAAGCRVSFAENEGLEDLDKATQLKVTAESLDDLNEVVDRLETALEKGLDDENT